MSKALKNKVKLNDVVSVKDFGAVGNGVVDDTVAIQAALNSGAKRIYCPSGNYKTTSVLIRPPQVKLFGDGCYTTYIVASHNGIIINTTPLILSGDTYNSIEDIGFKNAPTFTSSIGISLANLNQASIKRVRVEEGPIIGIQCDFVLNSVFEQISLISATNIGLYIYSPSLAEGNNRNIYTAININYAATGIRIDGTGTLQSVFSDVAVENTTVSPITVLNGSKIVFDRLYLEANTTSVNLQGGDDIVFRDTMNVSAQQFIVTSGFAATKVFVDRLYDGGGGGVISNGNVLINTYGQLKFPVTQNASTDPNTLDDYEEGTWTPSDSSGAGLIYTLGTCTYTKIGRMVVANFIVTLPSTVNTSSFIMGGLPFTPNNNYAVAISYTNESTLVRGTTVGTENYLLFYKADGTLITNADVSTNVVRGTVTYFV